MPAPRILVRRIALIGGSALVLVLIAVASTPFLIDWNWLKPRIEAAVREATGHELTIAGKVEVELLPQPSLRAFDIRFAEVGADAPDMATAAALVGQVQLWPLLDRRLVIEQLAIERPRLELVIDEAGRFNWDVAAVAETAGEPSSAPNEPAILPVDDLVLEEVSIDRGEVRFVDHRSGRRIDLHGLELQAVLRARGRTPAELLQQVDGRAEVGLKSITVEPGPIRELRDAKAIVELSQDGAGTRLQADLKVLHAAGELIPLNLTLELGPLHEMPSPGPHPIQAELQSRTISARADGEFSLGDPSAALDVSFAAPSLASLEPLLGVALPEVGPIGASAMLTLAPQELRLANLVARAGASDVAGSIDVALGGRRPTVAGTLHSKRLEWAELRHAGATAALAAAADASRVPKPGTTTDARHVIPDIPLPFERFDTVDADLSLRIQTLHIEDDATLSDIEAGVRLSGGRLEVDPLRTAGASGALEGRVVLDAGQEPPTLHTRLEVEDVRIAGLLREMTLFDPQDSTARASIDLKGTGASPRALAASLNGHVELSAKGGVFDLGTTRLLASGVSDLLRPLLGGGGSRTELRCFLVSYKIVEGVAISEATLIDSSAFAVGGGGRVDLRTEEIDLHFRPAPHNVSLMSLAVPFNLTGTLRKPRARPDPAGTLLGAAKSALLIVNPVTMLGALAASTLDGADKNACVAAVQAARTSRGGVGGAAESAVRDAGEAVEGVVGTGGKIVGGAIEGAGEVVKGIGRLLGR